MSDVIENHGALEYALTVKTNNGVKFAMTYAAQKLNAIRAPEVVWEVKSDLDAKREMRTLIRNYRTRQTLAKRTLAAVRDWLNAPAW